MILLCGQVGMEFVHLAGHRHPAPISERAIRLRKQDDNRQHKRDPEPAKNVADFRAHSEKREGIFLKSILSIEHNWKNKSPE